MWWLGGIITLFTIVLWVYAFFDALTSPAQEVRNLPKTLWLIFIALFMPVGSVLWLFLGRPRVHAETMPSASSGHPASTDPVNPSDIPAPPETQHPRGPDDDPEFLRRLNRRINPEE